MQIKEATRDNIAPQRIAELEVELAQVKEERDKLRAAYERLRLELELLRRRIFIAKAERIDTAQLEFEFAEKLSQLDQISKLDELPANTNKEQPERKKRSTGRRNLRNMDLEEERIELPDPLFEELVEQGKAERIGCFEESSKVVYKRGGMRRLVISRVKYSAKNSQGTSEIVTAPMPKETFPRCLAAPSMLAHVAVDKHCDGLPLYRLEDRYAREGFPIDRGTMSRWLEDLGATLGATIVEAARQDAMRNSFCIATDATGVLVQPEPREDKKRQPCRRGHYFVLVADRDHIFFEYTPKETSAVVSEMFKDFSGYVQADAKSIYDILFRPPARPPPDDEEEKKRTEVACWSHSRTKFWEGAVCKCSISKEGLARIGRLFDIDAALKGRAPEEIKSLRQKHMRPQMEAFFTWAEEQYELVREQRGLLRSALGYAIRQKRALMRVLEDGRLKMDNNRSERELRKIAIGRKAWLFVGSDDHGVSAGHLFSLIASARLHGLDPETYLRDMIRILAYWPKDRYLELAPKYWKETRSHLAPEELEAEIGHLTVPPQSTLPESII